MCKQQKKKKLKSFLKTSNKIFFFFYFHTQKQQQTSKSSNWAKQKKVKEFRGSFFNSKRANIRNEISGISRELKLCKSFPSLEGIFQPRELSFANRNLFMPFGDSLSLSVCQRYFPLLLQARFVFFGFASIFQHLA